MRRAMWMFVAASLLTAAQVSAATPSFRGLGDLPGGSYYGEGLAVSADGSMVVGYGHSAGGPEAFIWTEAAGMVGLGDLPGGTAYSKARDITPDGWVVVGYGHSAAGGEAFRWTPVTGMVALGDLPGGSHFAEAYGVSADGATVVGASQSSLGYEAFVWTEAAGMSGLGDLPGPGVDSRAHAASADGTVVVGYGRSSPGREAFRWTEQTGMVGLGDLPGGYFSSEARDVSADGSVVVGWSHSALGGQAFRWTEATGMVGLGDVPGGAFGSFAGAVSPDGSTVVGWSMSASAPKGEASRWTQATGMVGLGDLPGGEFLSRALDTSADGSVVVGYGSLGGQAQRAFIWDAENGMRALEDVLINDYGLDLSGWTLTRATGISADGFVIVGLGSSPNGRSEAWRAVIPEPSVALLAGLGLPWLVRRRRYRRGGPGRRRASAGRPATLALLGLGVPGAAGRRRRNGRAEVLLAGLLLMSCAGGQSWAAEARRGDVLVSDYFTDAIYLYDGTSGAYRGEFSSDLWGVDGITVLSDGDVAAALSGPGKIVRIDGRTGAVEGAMVEHGLSNPRSVTKGPDGVLWITNNGDPYHVVGIDPTSGREIWRQEYSLDFKAGRVAIGNGRIYVAVRDWMGDYSEIHQYDLETGASRGRLGERIADRATDEILVAPDGSVIVTAADTSDWSRGEILRLDPDTGDELARAVGYDSEMLALGPDGRLYARLWDTAVPSIVTLDPVSLEQTATLGTCGHYHGLAVATVPEPATLALLGLGAIGLFRRRRARKRGLGGAPQGSRPNGTSSGSRSRCGSLM